jgi:hypothetical protein
VDLGLTNITEEALVCPPDRDEELPEAAKIVVNEASRKPQYILLQLCEWHAVQAIKRRLVATGKYAAHRCNVTPHYPRRDSISLSL